MIIRLTMKFLFPWVLMGVLGAILFVLYMLSTNLSGVDRKRVEMDVRQMLALNTRIDLDVLRLRHRQLLDYDSITTASRKIEFMLERLEDDLAKMGLEEPLAGAKEAWQSKALKLDDFKRQNSVLVNSQYHFINLSNQVQASQSSVPEHRQLINAAIRSVLIFVSDQHASELENARHTIERLEKASKSWNKKDAALAALMVAHSKKILDNHMPVWRMMQTMSRNSFSQEVAKAYGDYLSADKLEAAKAENYRRLMTVFSLLMIVAVMAIVIRLQQTASELTQSHSLLVNTADHLSEGILTFDANLELSFLNHEAEQLLERSADELLGKSYDEVLPLALRGEQSFAEALMNGVHFEGEVWLKRANGTLFPTLFLGGPLPVVSGTGTAGYVTSFRDITAQHESEARLRLAARVFDSLSEAMAVTSADAKIQTVNAAFTQITGYTEAEVRGKNPGRILGSGQHDRDFFKSMWQTLVRDGNWRGEIVNRRKGGELYPEWLSITAVRDRVGKIEQYIALFSDISDRKQAEAHIRHMAYHDALTGLANKTLFSDRLETAMHQAHRSQKQLAVMYLDIDRFKAINDSLGHPAGDQLLIQVGKRLGDLLREGDTLARFGGDEFAVLLSEVTAATEAVTIARRILREFERPFTLAGREVFSSTSIGIALYPSDAASADDLIKNVDVALYNAKNAGRSTYQFFQDDQSEDYLARLELETALRHSVERGELRLFYQPQVSSDTQQIYGVEALVRWQHPTLGLIAPDNFIPLAESSGYIETLGMWCLETACRQMVEWQAAGVPIRRVAVNVSARQLRNPNFLDMVLNIIKSTGIPHESLEIELTESSMSDSPEKVLAIFSRLRKIGIRIAIDDFGTGYSSLSYLARYPVDVLKIDKSFVQAMATENDTIDVVRAIAVLAHSLNMEIVAEGVETNAQRKQLTDFGVELLQGYLYSRPVANEKLIELPCVKIDDDQSQTTAPHCAL